MLVGLEKEKAVIESAVDHNDPILIIGETGVGKTSLIREIAGERGKEFRRLNLNGSTGVEEFVGNKELEAKGSGTRTYWQDGVLIDAMRKGHWLLVDEINAALPEILFVLQSLLDDDRYVVLAGNKGEVVRPHPEFRIFAAMNPPGDYAGTKNLNRALMSRFGVVLWVDTPDVSTLEKILASHIQIEDGQILCRVADHINRSREQDGVEFYCSIRDLIAWAKLVHAGNDMETAFTMSILNKTDVHEREAVKAIAAMYIDLEGHTPPKDPKEMKKELVQSIRIRIEGDLFQQHKEIFKGAASVTLKEVWDQVQQAKMPDTHKERMWKILKGVDYSNMAENKMSKSKFEHLLRSHFDEALAAELDE